MIARWLIALCALIILTGTAAAQESAPAPAVEYTLPRSAEETLVNALPIGDSAMLTVTGERLMQRTMLKLTLTGPDGVALPGDTRIALMLNAQIFPNDGAGTPQRIRLTANPVWHEGAWYVGPYTFNAPGFLTGVITVGGDRATFEVGVYPNAPELPAWFAPVNVAVPFVVLAIILALLVGRRVTLTQVPARS